MPLVPLTGGEASTTGGCFFKKKNTKLQISNWVSKRYVFGRKNVKNHNKLQILKRTSNKHHKIQKNNTTF